jgi:hypothetical protein
MASSTAIPPPTPLPYFCTSIHLPAPLPTQDDIKAAASNLPTLRDPRYGRIVVVNGCFVVKYGINVTENEGYALLFLENHSFVPTPQLYAMYREDDMLYLIMSLMPGKQLGDIWNDLPEYDKLHIMKQLRSTWDYIRSIPASTSISNVTGGPLTHRFFFSAEEDPKITGPFQTEEDLCQALALHSHKNWEGNRIRSWTSEYFTRQLPNALKGHGNVFTHGDVQRKNILVEQVSIDNTTGGRQYRVSAILDWEDAGWYPSYWEYAAQYIDFTWRDDWLEKLETMLDCYPLESAMLKIVRQDLDY